MAFGDHSVLLDNFPGADEDPAATNWSGPIYAGEPQMIIYENTLRQNVGFANSYYDIQQFGPDCEFFGKVGAFGASNGGAINFFARIANPNNASLDAYRVSFINNTGGTDIVRIQRVDNTSTTTLGADIPLEHANGGWIGIECIGDQISAYYAPPGSAEPPLPEEWVLVGTRTDDTYNFAGWFGVEGSDVLGNQWVNEVWGGTIVAAPPSTPKDPKLYLRGPRA